MTRDSSPSGAGSGPLNLQVGGTVGPNDVYIARPEDDEVFTLLADGQYCNILTSRQMGKSSLMVRVKRRLREEREIRAATVEIAGELGKPTASDQWYIGFLEKVASDLELSVDVESWWTGVRGTSNQRLLAFFKDFVLKAIGQSVVIFVDEVDATLALAYSDEFFTALRAMHNARPEVPEYRRLTFCLIGAASPGELIKDPRTTPYNIGRMIELRDFDPARDDLKPLLKVLSKPGVSGETLMPVVLEWTGGHPFLTVALCELCRDAQTPLDVHRRATELFRSSRRTLQTLALRIALGGAIEGHFAWINTFLSERLRHPVAVYGLYDAILQGRKVRDDGTAVQFELRLSGLVKRDDSGGLTVRNKIYAHRFGRAWLAGTRTMQEYTRQTRLAVLFKATIAAMGVAVLVGIFVLAWSLFQERQKQKQERAERTAKLKMAILRLNRADDDATVVEVRTEICAILSAADETNDADGENAKEAFRAFLIRRAERIDNLATAALDKGEVEEGLLLGALATTYSSDASPWLEKEYGKSDWPHLWRTLRGHIGRVNRIRFLSSNRLVSIGGDGTLRLFDVERGVEIKYVATNGAATAIDVCSDGTCVFTASSSPFRAELWNAELSRRSSFTAERPQVVNDVALGSRIGEEGIEVAVVGQDSVAWVAILPTATAPPGPFDLGDPSKGREAKRFVLLNHITNQRPFVYAIDMRQDGKNRDVATAAIDGVRIFARSTTAAGLARKLPFYAQALDARLTSDGRRVLFAHTEGSAVYDVDGKELSHVDSPRDCSSISGRGSRYFLTAAYSSDEQWVANVTSAEENEPSLILVWNVADGKILFCREARSKASDAVFHPDPERNVVASAHDDGTVRLWCLKREQQYETDVQARWQSWQQKFGLTADATDRIVPLGSSGIRGAAGFGERLCPQE